MPTTATRRHLLTLLLVGGLVWGVRRRNASTHETDSTDSTDSTDRTDSTDSTDSREPARP